ncbi:MAG: hypothetical protein DCO95_10220 [Roseivirga sp. XM-24bin3]|nr:MAG: hypothetical protein DCO95_10220 [Roseivirga sp. XM-24bin3]
MKCCPTCLKMVARHYGETYDIPKLSESIKQPVLVC